MSKNVIAAILCSLIIICAGTSAEEQDKLGFNIAGDFYSKYASRGQNTNDDYVFQSGLSAAYKGFTASIWGNMDMTNYGGNSGEFTEYDLTLDYSRPITEKVGFSVGIINYHFPSVVGDTTEIYWGFNFDAPLEPFIKVYHDVDYVKGTYAQFGVGHTLEKIAAFSKDCYCDLQLGASIGWGSSTYNRAYWNVDESRLNDLAFTLAFPICFPDGWTVKPSVNYVTLVDGAIRNSDAYSTSSDYCFTGVGVSKSF